MVSGMPLAVRSAEDQMAKVGVLESTVWMMVNSRFGMTLIVQQSLHLHPHLQLSPKVVTMKGNGTHLVSLKVPITVDVGLERIVG